MSNQNNNNQTEKKDWKIYVSLFLYSLIGLAIGYALAKGVLYLVNKPKKEIVKVIDVSASSTKDFTGYVSSMFEGENKAELNFKTNSDLTVTQGLSNKSKYFYITNASGTNVATVYMSYEGGRGYVASEYIKDVIGKYVPSISAVSDISYASSSWSYTSSATSEWHIMPAKSGEWLVVIENKKSNHDALTSVYETFNVK